MARILPYQEHSAEIESERELGDEAADDDLSKSHAGLLQLVYVRDAIERSFEGKRFRVQNGDASGKEKRTVFLVLDQPVGHGPPWNPASTPTSRQYKLLSWTSKMNAPSFSLPAGAPSVNGTCPGASPGQSVVPLGKRDARQVEKYTGRTPNLNDSICQKCYATGGQYSTGGVQFAQVLRYIWVRQAIDQPVGDDSTMFIETMVAAIDNADFKLNGGKIKLDESEGDEFEVEDGDEKEGPKKVVKTLPPEPSGRRFFRIHDSGDFFSMKYLEQWREIARRLPDITFWAPSRVWAVSDRWIKFVNDINKPPSNLIIRPSGYEVGQAPPDRKKLGDGWAAGSSVLRPGRRNSKTGEVESYGDNKGMTSKREAHIRKFEPETKDVRAPGGPDERYTWDCRAYATKKGHECRSAVAPPGFGDRETGKGCRACWLAPDEIINYSLH